MFRTTLSLMLSGFVILAAVSFQATKAQTPQNMIAVEKVRAKVNKLGVGRNIRVEVKLHDDTKLKGYISAIYPDSFNLTDAKTGASHDVDYADVSEVKKSGGGISSRTWIILAGAATAATVVGFTVLKPIVCDGGAGC